MPRNRTWGSGLARSDAPAASPYHYQGGILTLALHVQPGARHTAWAGRHGEGALRLRLAAPAVEGRANRACLAFLAEAAGVPRRAVHIVRGERSRDKVVRIESVSEDRFRALVKQWRA